MARQIKFDVNGSTSTVDTHPDRTLLEVLREDLNLTGTKYGCGEGSCRSCVVMVDGRPKTSCQEKIGDLEGASIRTIESLADGDRLHPVQEAFVAESAMQCGYCVPGMVLTAVSLLENNPNPSREEIVEWMDGNLCRCTNYLNIVRAVERAAQTTAGAVS